MSDTFEALVALSSWPTSARDEADLVQYEDYVSVTGTRLCDLDCHIEDLAQAAWDNRDGWEWMSEGWYAYIWPPEGVEGPCERWKGETEFDPDFSACYPHRRYG